MHFQTSIQSSTDQYSNKNNNSHLFLKPNLPIEIEKEMTEEHHPLLCIPGSLGRDGIPVYAEPKHVDKPIHHYST